MAFLTEEGRFLARVEGPVSGKVLLRRAQHRRSDDRAAAAEMLKRGSGHIVSITTSITDQAMASVPAALANLTKSGINSATKALAIESAAKGIRVNAVSPGIVKTPMHPTETHEFLAALHPMKRMGEIRDVVEAVLYLETAGFVTREILHVDGGQSAGH